MWCTHMLFIMLIIFQICHWSVVKYDQICWPKYDQFCRFYNYEVGNVINMTCGNERSDNN